MPPPMAVRRGILMGQPSGESFWSRTVDGLVAVSATYVAANHRGFLLVFLLS